MNRWVCRYIWLTSLAFLGACSSGNEQPEGSQANFDLPPIEVVRTNPTGQDKATGLPNRLEFTLKVCPLDIALAQNVIGQDFQISGISTGPVTKNTGSNGCIQFTDSVDYSATKEEVFCQKNYQISGVSPYVGSFPIPIGINPLRTGSAAIVDLNHDSTVKIAGACGAELKVETAEAKLPIKLDFISFELTSEQHSPGKAAVGFHIYGRPKFMPRTADAKPVEIPKGKFKLDITILERKMTGSLTTHFPLAKAYGVEAEVDAGVLKADLVFNFIHRLPQQQADLVARIDMRPAEASSPFAASFFEAGFKWGEQDFDLLLRNASESFFAAKEADRILVADSAVFSEAEQPKLCRRDPHAFGFVVRDAPKIIFDTNDLKPVRRESRQNLFTDLAAKQTVQVDVTLEFCLQNVLYDRPISDLELEVGFGDPGKISKLQDAEAAGDGCVRFPTKIPQAIFLSNDWLEQNLVIKSKSDEFKGVERTLPVYVRGTANGQDVEVRDCLQGKPSRTYTIADYIEQLVGEIRTEARERKTRYRLRIPKMEVTKLGADYHVDDNLNLYAYPRYEINFKPYLNENRPSGLHAKPPKITNGRARIRTIIALPIDVEQEERDLSLKENLHVLSASESVLEIREDEKAYGEIFSAFTWPEIRTVLLRAYLITEVQLLDEYAEVPPLVTYTPINLMNPHADGDLTTYPVDDPKDFVFPNLSNPKDVFHEVTDLPRILEAQKGAKVYERRLELYPIEMFGKEAFIKGMELTELRPSDLRMPNEDTEDFENYINNVDPEVNWMPLEVQKRFCHAYFPSAEKTTFWGDFWEYASGLPGLSFLSNRGMDAHNARKGYSSRFTPADCMKDPRRFLAVKRMMWVSKVHSRWAKEMEPMAYEHNATVVLQNDRGFKRLEQETERYIRGFKAEFKHKSNGFVSMARGNRNGNFGFEFEPMIHAGLDWVSSYSKEEASRVNLRRQNEFQARFYGEEVVLEIDVDVEYCAYFRLQFHEDLEISKNDPGAMFCTTKKERRKVTESWYFLNKDRPDSEHNFFAKPLLDRKSNVWSHVVRGIGRIEYVNSLFRNSAKRTVLLRHNYLMKDIVEFRGLKDDPEKITYGPWMPDEWGDGGYKTLIEY